MSSRVARASRRCRCTCIEAPPSLSKAHRKPPEQMTVIVEDLIKMLDGVGNGYRRGRHPDARTGTKVATVLRAVADELEL